MPNSVWLSAGSERIAWMRSAIVPFAGAACAGFGADSMSVVRLGKTAGCGNEKQRRTERQHSPDGKHEGSVAGRDS